MARQAEAGTFHDRIITKINYMKYLISILSLLSLSLALNADELDEKLLLAGKFVDGNPADPLKFIELKAVESLQDSQLRNSLEEKIINSLGTANSRRGKDFLCLSLIHI